MGGGRGRRKTDLLWFADFHATNMTSIELRRDAYNQLLEASTSRFQHTASPACELGIIHKAVDLL